MKTISTPWIKIIANTAPFLLPKFDRVNYTNSSVQIYFSKFTEEISYKLIQKISLTDTQTLTFTLNNGVVKHVRSNVDDLLIDINSILKI